MAFTPYITRKLYTTTLEMKAIDHPNTPAPPGTCTDDEVGLLDIITTT